MPSTARALNPGVTSPRSLAWSGSSIPPRQAPVLLSCQKTGRIRAACGRLNNGSGGRETRIRFHVRASVRLCRSLTATIIEFERLRG
jgi:hypothetical protein